MLGHGLRVGEEAVGQALDLAGIEHAVGFLEAEDTGSLGVIIRVAAVMLIAAGVPAGFANSRTVITVSPGRAFQ